MQQKPPLPPHPLSPLSPPTHPPLPCSVSFKSHAVERGHRSDRVQSYVRRLEASPAMQASPSPSLIFHLLCMRGRDRDQQRHLLTGSNG